MKIVTNTGNFKAHFNMDEVPSALDCISKTRFRYADLDMYYTNEHSTISGPRWQEWAEGIAEASNRTGVKLVQAHSSDSVYEKGEIRDYTVNIIKRQIEVCRMLGIPHIVVHSLAKQGNSWKQQRAANKEFYASLLDTAEKNNVGMLLENGCYQNSRGMCYYVTAENFLTTIDDLDSHPLLNVCWDVGHAHMQGVDQYNEIVELGGRLKAVHIHDNFASGDNHMMPFMGNCGYDAIIMGLRDINYSGYFTLEAYSLMPSSFAGRKGYEKDGIVHKKLIDLPPELIIQAKDLMFNIARHMLEQYGCFEE